MPNVSDIDASDALRMSPSDAQTNDYNLLAAVAFVLLHFEELALLTNHCFKAAALGLSIGAFLCFNDAQHDRPFYLPPLKNHLCN